MYAIGSPLDEHINGCIHILQVANGWQVILPRIPDKEKMIAELRELQEGIQGGEDEIMTRIRRQSGATKPAPQLKDLKKENVFVFIKFSEVLAFLKVKVDE